MITKRREYIFLLYLSGMSLEAIGRDVGINRERSRQIVTKTARELERGDLLFSSLRALRENKDVWINALAKQRSKK